jgi:hypothetical protein
VIAWHADRGSAGSGVYKLGFPATRSRIEHGGIPEETMERVVEAERGRRIAILQGGAEWKGRQSGAKRGLGR